jgi:hypothetical protein
MSQVRVTHELLYQVTQRDLWWILTLSLIGGAALSMGGMLCGMSWYWGGCLVATQGLIVMHVAVSQVRSIIAKGIDELRASNDLP